MVCRLRSNSSEMSFRLTFCFSDLADLGRHRGVGAPPSEKQKVRRNGTSHGRGIHTNEESRQRSFQWCMNQPISSLFRVFDPLSVARTGNVHSGRRRSCGVTEGSNGRKFAHKADRKVRRGSMERARNSRRFMGFLLTFVHYAWRNRLAKFRRRVRAGG